LIKLNTDELCQKCPCFTGITQETLYAHDHPVVHVIDCENRELCNHLRSYLEKKYKSDAERKLNHK